MQRLLTVGNVGTTLAEYSATIVSVGDRIQGKLGLELLQEVKRVPTRTGPYPEVTLFEAAKPHNDRFGDSERREVAAAGICLPFLGVPRRVRKRGLQRHDLMAENEDERLVGEAFNVAPSFFQAKKAAMLRKLRMPENREGLKLILANADAVGESYRPKLRANEHMVLVPCV